MNNKMEERNDDLLKRKINDEVKSIVSKRYPDLKLLGIFDPVQSHAIYGVHKCELDDMKDYLRGKGATKFRTVSKNRTHSILCFSAKGMVTEWKEFKSFI